MIELAETPATFFLLMLNVLISGYALYMEPGLIQRWGLRPYDVANYGQWHRMISGGFLHGGLMHLGFNMMTLYYFGPVLERYLLGTTSFIILYVGSLLVAHFFTYAAHKNDPDYTAVGASGAISGVLLSFCMFEPMQLLYFFGIVPIPAIIFAVGFIWYSIYASRTENATAFGNIAHEAHLGGGIAGIILTILLEPRAIGRFFSALADFFGNLF